ncbi:MAG: endonuclease [Myxococcales bacterium]|nr:endonuclease [Myxococcales bacterium]
MRSLLALSIAVLAGCADPPLDPAAADVVPKGACEAQARGLLAVCGPPAGYYDAVDARSPVTLRATLHAAIDDHRRIAWNRASGVDTWVMLEAADAEPGRPGWLRDLYRHDLYRALGGGYGDYDREHAWPKSYGFPDENAGNLPYTDGHALFIADSGYNSSRGNNVFGWCDTVECEARPIADGSDRNVVDGERDAAGTWETWSGRRGDVARALFYLDVRYEGGLHGGTGRAEPDLVLTDDRALITASNTGRNEALAYMGLRRVLIEWHRLDPPDARERARNDIIASYQGNRNPFVDHPEWVECLFVGDCGAAAPAGDPWIGELHYDNAGADVGEFVEVQGPAGRALDGWSLVAYNGRDGRAYAEVALAGRIDDEGGGRGALAFDFPGLQNGDPDGIALVDPNGRLVEFLGYEGGFIAVDGPAAGEGSDAIDVSETGETPVGHAINRGADGTWSGPRPATRGRIAY